MEEERVPLQEDPTMRLRRALGNRVPRADEYYEVKNVVRRVQTRLRRAAMPGRLRFRQQVAGRRLLRGQSMMLKPAVFEQYREQILAGVLAGALEVVDPDGVRYFVDPMGKLCKAKPGTAVQTLKPKAVERPEPKTVEQVEPKTTKHVEPDDLTQLPGIGAGRAKKLEAAGVTTYKQVAVMSPGDLVKIVGSPLTEDQASDICDAASEMEG